MRLDKPAKGVVMQGWLDANRVTSMSDVSAPIAAPLVQARITCKRNDAVTVLTTPASSCELGRACESAIFTYGRALPFMLTKAQGGCCRCHRGRALYAMYNLQSTVHRKYHSTVSDCRCGVHPPEQSSGSPHPGCTGRRSPRCGGGALPLTACRSRLTSTPSWC